MGHARLVTDPARMIVEFDVYRTDTGWRAVYQADRERVLEAADWEDLFYSCVGCRIGWGLRDRFGASEAHRH